MQLLSLKPKVIMHKHHQISVASIQIRYKNELKQFLTFKLFQKKHLQALISQSFDPMLTLNGI